MNDRRRMSVREHKLGVLCLLAICVSGEALNAQLTPFPSGPAVPPQKSYADFYRESIESYTRPPVSVRDYTIDRYYYHNPNLSPYLNLTRLHGRDSLNNYYRYVLPEVERRSTLSVPPTPGPGAFSSPVPRSPMTGPIRTPVAPLSPSAFHNNLPYFNNYYNSFGGGLKR